LSVAQLVLGGAACGATLISDQQSGCSTAFACSASLGCEHVQACPSQLSSICCWVGLQETQLLLLASPSGWP